MLISHNLLTWINPEFKSWTPQEISSALFSLGIEIDAEYSLTPQETIKNVTILDIEKIPETKLFLCKVKDQNNQEYSVICGANNIYINQQVLLALPGSLLNKPEPLAPRKFLNKYDSAGMLLSFKELAPWTIEILPNSCNSIKGILEISPEEYQELLSDTLWSCTFPYDKQYLKSPFILAKNILACSKNHKPIKTLSEHDILNNLKPHLNYTTDTTKSISVIFETPESLFDKNLKLLYLMNNIGNHQYINLISHIYSLNPIDLSPVAPWANYNLLIALKSLIKQIKIVEFNYHPQPSKTQINFFDLFNNFCKFNHLTFEEPQIILEKLTTKGFAEENNQLSPPPWYIDDFSKHHYYNEFSMFVDWNNEPSLTPLSYWHEVNNQHSKNITTHHQTYINNNFFECQTYNLQPLEEVLSSNFLNYPAPKSLLNSLNTTKKTLRFNALHQLLQVHIENQFQQNNTQPLFEINTFPSEETTKFWVNLLVPQQNYQFPYNNSGFKYDFIDLKTIIQKILPVTFVKSSINFPEFNSNYFYSIQYNEKTIGYIGQLSSDFMLKYKLPLTIPIIYVGYELIDYLPPTHQLQSFNSFPASFKDFSIEIPSNFSLNPLIQQINCIPLVEWVKIKEKYCTNEQSSYSISILLSVRISSFKKTLTTEEIQSTITSIKQWILNSNLKLR